jgi:hypothetical protein
MKREVESFGKQLIIEQDLQIVNKEAGAMIWDSTFVLMKSVSSTMDVLLLLSLMINANCCSFSAFTV